MKVSSTTMTDRQTVTDVDNKTPTAELSLDKLIRTLVEISERPSLTPERITEAELIWVCTLAREVFMQQDACLKIDAPIHVAGDIHGQYGDLLRLFRLVGFPPTRWLFLGDYVDRGHQSIECISLLFALKCKYPMHVFLLRGNHECPFISRTHGFYDECKYRYSPKLWRCFQESFHCMPFSAIINNRILCMHGGLSTELNDLSMLDQIPRPYDPPDYGLACDLLWADPDAFGSGWHINQGRAVSYTFGADVVNEFCAKHGIEMIARAHQVVPDGYEFFAGRRLVTLFSAPNYCNEFGNDAAVMSVDTDLTVKFDILKCEKRKQPPSLLGTDDKTKTERQSSMTSKQEKT